MCDARMIAWFIFNSLCIMNRLHRRSHCTGSYCHWDPSFLLNMQWKIFSKNVTVIHCSFTYIVTILVDKMPRGTIFWTYDQCDPFHVDIYVTVTHYIANYVTVTCYLVTYVTVTHYFAEYVTVVHHSDEYVIVTHQIRENNHRFPSFSHSFVSDYEIA